MGFLVIVWGVAAGFRRMELIANDTKFGQEGVG